MVDYKNKWIWCLAGVVCVFILAVIGKQQASIQHNSLDSLDYKATVEAAKLCSSINARLERLQCYDKLFPASIEELLESTSEKKKNEKPEEWIRGVASEDLRTESEEGFRMNILDKNDPETSVWYTARAEEKGTNTILQLGCLDKISRVELLLTEPVQEGRITVTVMGDKPFTQQWTADESGLILRPGRGIPAIRAMRAMLNARPLVIRSDVDVIDGLTFDNRGLEDIIVPMRTICGW
ncbi:type VI secretion system-associated protein VasI [Halodesulfovibrio aestuarii]|uniref:type VI secretion system-associated protein VasI n=1 Tax=Halodesulfovibrio aestuarii TaxID=126333 RepID=UPI003528A7DB